VSGYKGILNDHGGLVQRNRRSHALRPPGKARLLLQELGSVRDYDPWLRPYHVVALVYHALRRTPKAIEGRYEPNVQIGRVCGTTGQGLGYARLQRQAQTRHHTESSPSAGCRRSDPREVWCEGLSQIDSQLYTSGSGRTLDNGTRWLQLQCFA